MPVRSRFRRLLRSGSRLRRGADAVRRLGLRAFGDREYVRFVVVSRARSGSNLLVSLLDSHPHVSAAGEEFQWLRGRSTGEVWREVFGHRPRRTRAVGFKLFYYHPLDSEDRSVWKRVRDDEDIRIIHLRRENLLRALVSREIAGKTDAWTRHGADAPPLEAKRVALDVESCLARLGRMEARTASAKRDLADHPVLDLTYEELTGDVPGTMDRVFAFLGLDSVPVSTSMRKQNREQMRDLVENYDELAERLATTPYARFLE